MITKMCSSRWPKTYVKDTVGKQVCDLAGFSVNVRAKWPGTLGSHSGWERERPARPATRSARPAYRPGMPCLSNSWERPTVSGQNTAETWLLLTIARRVPRNMFKNRPHLLNLTSSDLVTFPVMHYYSLERNTNHSLDWLWLWLFLIVANKYASLQLLGGITHGGRPCTRALFRKLTCLCLVLFLNRRINGAAAAALWAVPRQKCNISKFLGC